VGSPAPLHAPEDHGRVRWSPLFGAALRLPERSADPGGPVLLIDDQLHHVLDHHLAVRPLSGRWSRIGRNTYHICSLTSGYTLG
jgi:hypothetical protein